MNKHEVGTIVSIEECTSSWVGYIIHALKFSFIKVMYTQHIRYVCVFGSFFMFFVFYWSYPRRQNCVASRNLRWNINKNMIDNQAFTRSMKIINMVCVFCTVNVYIAPQVHCSSSRKQLIQLLKHRVVSSKHVLCLIHI
jgi:hypothetical protein